jgi:mono/diheme cytochrome c family protein
MRSRALNRRLTAGIVVPLLVSCASTDDGGAAETEGGSPTETSASTTTGPDADGSGGGTTEGAAAVTYHGQVRALLESHCVACHTTGNIAPFPLTSYADVFALRETIVAAVDSGTMPPWMPADDCRGYVGDLTMQPEQIEMLHQWVDEGGAEGDPADYVAPMLPPNSGLTRVDVSLASPEPYTPTQSPDDYRCFLLDWPETDVSYVSGFQAVPDDLSMVHHVIAFAVRPQEVAQYEALDAAEPGAGYTCFGGPGGEITDAQSAGMWLGAWAPGSVAGDFPAGTGIAVQPGSKIVLQVHYNTLVADPGPDQTSVEFKVDTTVDTPAHMMLWSSPQWLQGEMPIPAGDAAVEHTFELDPTPFVDLFTDVVGVNEPFVIRAATHHMHTLGTVGKHSIVHADGSETCLLSIPRWDFNWQSQYRFEEPQVFHPGDKLRLHCEWDNSAGTTDVNWGDGTQDEMCLGIFFITAE